VTANQKLRAQAETMFVREGGKLQDIAGTLGVHRSTLSRWRQQQNWDAKKGEYLQNSPMAVLDLLKKQREQMIREAGGDPPTPAYADALYKISTTIERMETKAEAVGPVLDVMDRFARYARLNIPDAHMPIVSEAVEQFLNAVRRGEV